MKPLIKISFVTALASVMALPSLNAQKSNWGPWQGMGNGVSVRFSKVELGSGAWTWSFRNDWPTTITRMTFKYVDKDGEHADMLAFPMPPHHTEGGWMDFTVSSHPTSFEITEIKRK